MNFRIYAFLALEILRCLLTCGYLVNAQEDGDARLIGGLSQYEGRVEVLYDGKWNTICDDSWDTRDASVICRQLGYEGTDAAFGNAYFGPGRGDILMDEVRCTGDESTLLDCPSDGFYIHNCDHSEDSGVRCLHNESFLGEVRLTGGSVAHEGRVEIYYENEWGTICDSHWEFQEAYVICKQLGHNGVYRYGDQAYFGEGSGPIMNHIDCNGDEPNWLQCHFEGWNSTLCAHSNDAGVICSHLEPLPTPYQGSIRLIGGASNNIGRVEIFNQGEWGTICDNDWSYEDASVICRQLGFGGVDTFLGGATYGEGSGPIMGQLGCRGNEWFWQDCTYTDWDTPYCGHAEDVAVLCSLEGGTPVEGGVRLAGDASEHSGRVEVYHDGEWGTICDNGWSLTETNVICKQLGYPGAIGYETGAHFGSGSGPVFLDHVTCDGSEHFITECDHTGWYTHVCSHEEDVGVRCQIPGTYYPRLVDGNSWYEGRVEVWDGIRWERFCSNNFYEDEARTVCQQLGYLDYETILPGDQFGVGYAPPSDVGFHCGSNDNELAYCYIVAIKGTSYCGSVAVRCKQPEDDNVNVTGIVVGTISGLLFTFACYILICQVSKKRKCNGAGAAQTVHVKSGEVPDGICKHSNSHVCEVAAPPSYNDAINGPAYYLQTTGVTPTEEVVQSPLPTESIEKPSIHSGITDVAYQQHVDP